MDMKKITKYILISIAVVLLLFSAYGYTFLLKKIVHKNLGE